jgi:hypothetical protein
MAENEDVSVNDSAWPEKGDSLFAEVGAGATAAPLAQDVGERWHRLQKGYCQAIYILIDEASSDITKRNSLVYPILFCSRHFIELVLKHIIIDFIKDGAPERMGHDLRKLWDMVSGLCRDHGVSDDTLISIQNLIDETSMYDPGSFLFRYATSRSGQCNGMPVDCIDLDKVREVVSGIDNFFDALSCDLRVRFDYSTGEANSSSY